MGSVVQFRDLPGGPMKIKFADEITRHCLCKSCNMLSLTMYADPASHFFCETCIHIQSYKHKKYDIYCPDERRHVSFDELFEARDVITILRDQYVECPNRPNCTLKIPLEQLESHYIECMHLRSIKCTKCDSEVEASSWNKHKPDCKPTYDTKFTSQESNSRNNRRDLPVVSPSRPPGSTSKKTGTTKRTTGATGGLYPADQLDQLRRMTDGDHGQGPSRTETSSLPPYPSDRPRNHTGSDTERSLCPYCERKVKAENMQRHLEKCYDLPIECPFCNQQISRKDEKEHVDNCQRDFERRSEESKKNEVAKISRDQPRPQPSHSAHAAYQGSKNIGAASSKSPRAARQEPSLTSGFYTDGKAWQPYATSGNWYAACVIIEEQFRGTEAGQAARWAHFVPKLEHLKLQRIVRDLIDDPYEPQPFDCLITALIARCCLPQEVWPQGLRVTWDHILMYVPSVLQDRLTEGAKSHLRKHAVYLDSHGHPGIEGIGVEAADAVVPRSPQSVTSPKPATKEAQARSVNEVDVPGATQVKSREANTVLALVQGEEGPSRKKAKKMSVAESVDVTSKLGRLTVSETSTEAESFQENEHLKSRGEPQEKKHGEGTSQSQPGKAVWSLGGHGNNATSSARETSATISKLPSRRRSETSALEPSASSKLDDSSIAEPLPNSEGLSDSECLRPHDPPQQDPHVEVTSDSRPEEASRVSYRLGKNTCAPLGDINAPLDMSPSRFQTASPVSEPPAPSKCDELSMTESLSNTRGLHDGPLGQPQQKLHVVMTSESQLEKGARLFDGLYNNTASSQCQNSKGVLFISPSENQSKRSAPEPPASSKPHDLNVTEASSNIGELREDKYSRSQGQSQQTLRAESTPESRLGAGAGLLDGLGNNTASSKPETSTVLSKLPSWNRSQHSAPEPPAHFRLGDSSATEAVPDTEGWREGGYLISQSQPQENVHAESTCQSRAGKGASLLDGRGNNTASSQRQNSTALSKLRWWYGSEPSALPLPAPSKLDDLSTNEVLTTAEGLSAGVYLRPQDQLQQKPHVESSYESLLKETCRLLDEFDKNTAHLNRETSAALRETYTRKQSEPSAPEPPAYCEVDALKTTEVFSNTEKLRGGEYLRPKYQSEESLHVRVTSESRPGHGDRFLDKTGNNTTSLVRQNSTALFAPTSRYQSDPLAFEPPAPSKSGELAASEVPSNTEGLREGTCQPQLLDDDTSEKQSKKTDDFCGGLNTAFLQQKISTSLDKPSSWHQSEPLATKAEEILRKSTNDGKHISDVIQPFQKTYAEALKQPGMTPTTADARHIDTKRVTCSERSDCYEAHKPAFHRKPETFSKEEPVCSTMPEERKMGSRITTGKTDRPPSTREKGKTFLDGNAKENDTATKYSLAGGMTITNKCDPHLERIPPEHCMQAAESRSTRNERSQRRSSHEERVFWNSSRNSQHSRSGTAQQRGAVIEQGQSRCASRTVISRMVIETAGQPSRIPCDMSNAGTRHTSAVSRMRVPDQKFLWSSLASSTSNEEIRVLEEGHKVSISTESKREHDAGVASPAEGTRTATCGDALTGGARDVEMARGRVRRPSEEATVIASASHFPQRQDYSADDSAFGAACKATSCQASDVVVAGNRFQLDIPCSQEIQSGRTCRAFSSPADIIRQGTPDLNIPAGYRSAKSFNQNREPMKKHHESVLNSRQSLQKDTSFVMETEV